MKLPVGQDALSTSESAKEATHLLALPQLAFVWIYRPAAADVGIPTPEDLGVAGSLHLCASQNLVAEGSSQDQATWKDMDSDFSGGGKIERS